MGKGTLSYDASRKQEEGIVVVHVKAGSLARGLLEKMLKSYASKSGLLKFRYIVHLPWIKIKK